MKSHQPDLQTAALGFTVRTAVLVFFLALLTRLLFLFATPDATGPFSPYYKGDTPVWLDYASAILSSTPFNHGLPMRPPGVAYLTALIWDGQASSHLALKLAWLVMGAASVAVFYVAILRSFGYRPAVIAALLMASSTALMIASTAPNNETPYLLLIAIGLALWKQLASQPGWKTLIAWSAVNGLACLIRVEHVLFFALTSLCLCWLWAHHNGGPANWPRAIIRAVCIWGLFGLVLLPWQLHIWSEISRFNTQPLPLNSQTEQAYQQLERGLAVMDWSDGTIQARQSLPVFMQRPMNLFVGATVAVRGRMSVTGDDFNIIEDAFGYHPQAISPYALVSIYGGLNFYLANHPGANGGFNLLPLEQQPPLSGGSHRYPAFLVNNLPPKDLTFTYPPHLQIINQGYAMGWQWILHHPADMLSLIGKKLELFWSGVSMGVTGYNLPLGLSGTRGMVDMVTADKTPAVVAWRIACVFILLAGLWVGRRHKALIPWLMILATKLITTIFFYGYAREGLVVVPVFALSAALLVNHLMVSARWSKNLANVADSRRWFFAALIVSLTLLMVEGVRWNSGLVVRLDGVEVGEVEPFPAKEYRPHRLEVGK